MSRDRIAHWGFPVTMALPASIFSLLDIWGVAILYHGSTCIGCLRGSFRNPRASRVVFSEPLVYWPTFPRLSLAIIWILPNPDSYAWAHFSSSTSSYFTPCARMTILAHCDHFSSFCTIFIGSILFKNWFFRKLRYFRHIGVPIFSSMNLFSSSKHPSTVSRTALSCAHRLYRLDIS